VELVVQLRVEQEPRVQIQVFQELFQQVVAVVYIIVMQIKMVGQEQEKVLHQLQEL
tara:strand:- start:249 stop:416 length:168 start_codon:yes stop_codon:yes gene_type:complete